MRVLAFPDLDAVGRVMRAISWDDIDDVHDTAGALLEELAAPGALGALAARVPDDPALLAACERFNLFTKVVLHEDPESGVRLRLHVFGDEMVEEAHNHRATFCARILHGRYRHYLYTSEEHLRDRGITRPVARWRQDQLPGYVYTLHHELVHSTYADPRTVSLVLQGPRERDSFRIIDLADGRERVRQGADSVDGAQEPGEQRLGRDGVLALLDRLRALGVIA